MVRRYLPYDQWKSYFKFTFERNPWELAVSAYHWYHRDDSDRVTFTEFVFSDVLPKYSNWRLYTINDQVVVDRVYRYERLPEALDDLSSRLGFTDRLELPRAKGSYRQANRPYWEAYSKDEQRRVAEVFQKEIAHFAWTFGE
jgi:hypothetical protein